MASAWYLLHKTKGKGYLLPFFVGYVYSSVLAFASVVGISFVDYSKPISTVMFAPGLILSVGLLVATLLLRKRQPAEAQHWGLLTGRAYLTAALATILLIVQIVKVVQMP